MAGVRARGEQIREFILENVAKHPNEIVRIAADRFDITRQAVNVHIQRLIEQKVLVAEGNTRKRSYRLQSIPRWDSIYEIKAGLAEDRVWREDVAPQLGQLPDNVLDIWHYGFTEMFNNALDHSDGRHIAVSLSMSAVSAELMISDDGEGIFRRIQRILGLEDERHAILELAKGKLTTDPDNHTGEGIYFSSRMFDHFQILSGGVYFSHEHKQPEDWILERPAPKNGTTVFMQLANNSARTVKKVFDKYTAGEEFGFNKTVVPVNLARYGNERLVSRSQAERLLARVDRFKIVIFDFKDVDRIGQAFADEVFRVFQQQHPEMQLHFINTVPDVQDMIIRALGADSSPPPSS
jgi:uncharacterized protein (DUF1330 family)